MDTKSVEEVVVEDEEDEKEQRDLSSVSEGENSEVDDHLDPVVALMNLLEIAVHQILYIRHIYLEEWFEQCKAFDLPVHQCNNAIISTYISDIMIETAEELSQDNLIALIINLHQLGEPVEKYIFMFNEPGEVKYEDLSGPRTLSPFMVQNFLETLLTNFKALNHQLLPFATRDDLSFSIVLQTKDENIDSDVSDVTFSLNSFEDPALVHFIQTKDLNVFLLVQESNTKASSSGPSKSMMESKDGKSPEPIAEL